MSNLKIGVVGLGYAGFPIAYLFSEKYEVTGFDISEARVSELNTGHDRCGDISDTQIKEMIARGGVFTTDIEQLRQCNFYVVVVPTPVDNDEHPDFSYVRNACRKIGQVLSEGDIVVFESTVYPGATEEICVPEIESASGLAFNKDFFVGYSPERINPGDKTHTVDNVVKVTSGSTPEAARFIDSVYASVLGEGNTWSASSIRVAEACKVIENTQRDVNIAFINEITQILNALDIDTNEVIDAMNTKWNALGFRPGLVGGHCIGVDPYYLIARAAAKGVSTNLMTTARRINNSMPDYVARNVVALMEKKGLNPAESRILLLGFTFKENCPDIRNTRVFDIYRQLSGRIDDITIYDPWADNAMVRAVYGIELKNRPEQISNLKYDAIVLCVAHNVFKDFDLEGHSTDNGIVYDVKGLFRDRKNVNHL